MGSFLDKVGLQHFVEKIKGLLSGYLPLSGGTMTGAINYGETVTLNTLGLSFMSSSSSSEQSTKVADDGFTVNYRGSHPEYGSMQFGAARLTVGGLTLAIANAGGGSASFNIKECETKKFVLSRDSSSEGLIANNSETVVKELSDDQVDKLLAGDTSTISDSKYYVSGANLGKFAQSVAKDKSYTIIYAEGGNVEVKTSNGNVTVGPGTSTRIDEICPVINGAEFVASIVYKGYAQDGLSFGNMNYLTSIDVFDLNTSNVTDMSAYFSKCSNLSNFGHTLAFRDMKFWDTRKVVSFEVMFIGCSSLGMLDLRYWNTQNVIKMGSMFANCRKLSSLNLEGWDTRSVDNMEGMFTNCQNMSSLQLGEGFGRMMDYVGTLDLSMMSKWTNISVESLTKLYDRKANGMGVITIKLSAATKNALGTSGIQTLTAKGYTIA